jgi:LmbE family N-acetylglucosaminyl deacetylase
MLSNIKNKKILVIAAHPDDEILGCGASLIKFVKKGYAVKCIFIADGESSRNLNKPAIIKKINLREKQALKISKNLNFMKPEFFRQPDNKLDSIPILKIIQFIEKQIKNFKPSVIFTHSQADLNVDHVKVCKATLTATRPFSKTFVPMLLSFEIPSNSELSFSQTKKIFIPNFFVDISKQINLKINALKIYKNEIRKPPHPRSAEGVKNLSKYRGTQSGLKFAEAFHILRIIN